MKSNILFLFFVLLSYSNLLSVCIDDVDMNNQKVTNVKSAFDVHEESNNTIDISSYALTFDAVDKFSVGNAIPYFLSPLPKSGVTYPESKVYCYNLRDSDATNDGINVMTNVSTSTVLSRTTRGDHWFVATRETIIYVVHQARYNYIYASKYGTLNTESGYFAGYGQSSYNIVFSRYYTYKAEIDKYPRYQIFKLSDNSMDEDTSTVKLSTYGYGGINQQDTIGDTTYVRCVK